MTTDTNPFSGVAVIATSNPTIAGITPKQESFLNSLLAERPMYRDVENLWAENVAKLTKTQASRKIDGVLKVAKETAAPTGITITEGFWVLGTEVYKVQRAVHGSGHLYAKHLNEYGIFDYAAGAIGMLRSRGAEKLTLERARELGKLYGRCMICGATLTDETSIANGIGPVCGSRLS
ncbi:MAG TPA: DUF6011 domain-containing protein [Rhodoglobus sp.]|nr:DUF6011 domain-containing protein [Rhodoglobus sp.]